MVMGVLDFLKKKEEPAAEAKPAQQAGKYDESCALCGEQGAEKKWAGQYWHVKCIRKAKKAAKGMV